ncbi:MAG TPA: 3-dehydroquinate synthase [archaeon]|nr:3-dehydroquinate synthase [archaeon]
MKEVFVRLKKEIDDSYPILIRAGLLDEAAVLLAERFSHYAFALVSDSNVDRLYAKPLLDHLRALGCRTAELISFPAGEESKNREVKARIEDRMCTASLGRDTVVVAVGGGVAGDLAGFVAATYARGVRFVQVPTSLLAMVDSSIGGKTGVNVPWGKNLVGAFCQPSLVIIDPRVLATLDPEQLTAGMAEVVKHGVILDAALFSFIEENLEKLTALREEVMADMVARNCQIKAMVVEKDERESNLRQILNFGHTVGHALEALSGYSWLHGQAVACGMAVEAEIAVRMGLFPKADADRLSQLLGRLGLPVDLAALKTKAEKVVGLTYLDKKARGGSPKYVLPRRIGEMARSDSGAYGIDVQDRVALEALVACGALN